MTTFNWTISTTERELSDGGVIVAHWRCNASDGDYNASSYGTAGFTPNASAPDFTPYDDLTEEQVLAWVWESVDKESTEASLSQKIESDKNPTTGAGVPW